MEEDQFNSLKITSKITQKKVVFIIDFYEFFLHHFSNLYYNHSIQ
jgi:hypothetical protein